MPTRSTLALGFASVAVYGALAAAPVTYGKGVTLSTATPLASLLKSPATFEGKTVRVEGVVTAVCEHMGCWMALGAKDAAGEPTLMIKVDDGVIVFPVSARGKKATAQGVMQRVKADDHEANEAAREKAHAAHGAGHGSPTAHADGHGAPAAPADGHGAHAAPSASDTWMLKATGAIVY